jgi:tripartite-type tricarboxylate transporter receptor subunit TctC
MIKRRIARISLLWALAAGTFAAVAATDQYPSRPISLIVPYSAGGPTDLAARNLGNSVLKLLGQPMLVLNRPGAAGAIGSQFVRNAVPDGYTMLLARAGAQAISVAIDSSVPYKWNDFTFISLLEFNPIACAARPDAPYGTLRQLIDYLRANQGKLNYASSGDGTIPYMATQVLFSTGGLPKDVAANIPYKSDADSVNALLGNQVQFMCSNATAFIPYIKAGTLRGLAVAMPERLPDLAQVPTAREQGYPEMEKVVGWSALYGPPGMSNALIEKWRQTLEKVAHDPKWVALNAKFGGVPAIRSRADTEKFVREQFDFYNDLITRLGVRK